MHVKSITIDPHDGEARLQYFDVDVEEDDGVLTVWRQNEQGISTGTLAVLKVEEISYYVQE